MSRNQINRLGIRLAEGSEISAADDRLLEELIACHLETLDEARPRLDGLAEQLGTGPLHISHRPKTTGTIIDKLRRAGRMPLATMQDLAGIRVVGTFSLADQDRLAAEIAERFPADPRVPRVRDRRAEPSHGYRAVHVIVSMTGVTIEIQIRTIWQHFWADLMERLADRLGRQIRYGGPPEPPSGVSQEAANAIVRVMLAMSDSWAAEQPEIPGVVIPQLEQLTEQIWSAFSGALAGIGIDL